VVDAAALLPCWDTKSINSSNGCSSSQGLTKSNSPSVFLVGESAFLSHQPRFLNTSTPPRRNRYGTYPSGVTATLTLCPLSRSFSVLTFHVRVAAQLEAPPRNTKGRLRATYRMNSRAEMLSEMTSTTELFNSW
jgi:hypothetical protein